MVHRQYKVSTGCAGWI